MADLALMHKTWKSWIGQRVCIKKSTFGTLKYFGEIKFKDGFWCGVELDEPVGEHNGMMNNVQYFKCRDYCGIFVPVYETTRLKSSSSEGNSVCDLIKLKYAGCREPSTSTDVNSTFSQNQNPAKLEMDNEIIKKSQLRSSSDLNKTFCKNELKNIPDEFDFKVPNERLHIHNIGDIKYENVSRRSKNTYGRLETEESLGIISDLLDEEESWNLLDQSITKRILDKCLIQKSNDDMDSVFYPPTETSYPDGMLNLCAEQVNSSIQESSNSKYTSTPKRCFSNILDLNRTVKVDDKQSFDFLHDEPIVAGSSKLNFETDFDLAKFKQSDILCSTLKSLSSLPIPYSASDEMSCVNNELAKSKKNGKYQNITKLGEEKCKIPAISNVFVNTKQFANIHEGCVEENSDILNTTFIINSDLLSSSAASTSLILKDSSPHAMPESPSLHLNKKFNCVLQIDSTFVAQNNFDENVFDGEKTFIIDCSPIKIPKASSLVCETIRKKKTLSIIFEKANSVNSAAESEDEPNNTTNESFISSKLSSNNTDKIIKSSLSKIASDLNSTFCVNSNASTSKKNSAYVDVKKRYSLSSISVKNNVCIKKEKSVITSLKSNGRKSITQSRLSVITKRKSLQSSSSANSTSALKQFKETKSRDKNETEVASNKFLEMMPRRKLKKTCSTSVESSSDVPYAREQLKKTLESCKSVDSLGVKTKNESDSTLKVSEINSKFIEKFKGDLPTKVQKMPLTFKEITSEYSNFNRKVNELKDPHECNSKNPLGARLGIFNPRHSMLPTDLTNSEDSNFNRTVNEMTGFHEIASKGNMGVKLGNIKQRHSMLPTILANSTRTKNSISRDGSDVKCIKNAVKSSFLFPDGKSIPPSKIHQHGFGDTRSTEREYMEKKSVPAGKALENNIKCDKKKENRTILKSKLLKPGTLSRLPVPEKLSKKPGSILNTVDPQSQHHIKSVNKTDNKKSCRRLPLKKLQDEH